MALINIVKTKFLSLNNKTMMTIVMNHLVVIYAFLLSINHYAATAVLSVIFILFLIRRNFLYYLSYSFSNTVVQAFLLFFAIHIIWLFGTDNYHDASGALRIAKNTLYPLVLMAVIDIRYTQRIIAAFVLGMLFSEIISYSIHFEILPWKLEIFNIVLYRAYQEFDPSPFLHHSHYALALSLTISILIWKILDKKTSTAMKAISSAFVVTASTNLALVGGRIGYVTFILLLTLLVILKYKRQAIKPLSIMILGLGFVAYMGYTYSNMVHSRVNETVNTIEVLGSNSSNYHSSFGYRWGFWHYSFEVISDNPILGTGTGDAMDSVKKCIDKQDDYLKEMSHSHNEYIQVLLQFGLVGFFIFLNIFYQIFKTKIEDEYKRFILFSTSFAISIALLTETLDTNFYFPLWVFLTSVALSNKKWVACANPAGQMNSKILLYYFVVSLLFLIIGKLQ